MDSQTGNLLQNQSLLKEKHPHAVDYSASSYKLTALNALTGATALLTGYTYRGYFENSIPLSIVLVAVIAFGICSALELFLNKYAPRRAAIVVLEIIGLLAFFWDEPSQLLLATGGILALLFFWGEVDGRRAAYSLMNMRFMWVAKLQLKKVITALVLMGVLFYVPYFDRKQTLIHPDNFRQFFGWGASMAHAWYPNVKFDGTWSEFRDSFIRSELASNSQFEALPQDEQALVVKEKGVELTQALNKNLGIAINPSGLSSDIFYQSLEATLKNWRKEFGGNFTAAWALTLFFIVQTFGLLFYSLVAFAAYLAYELLRAAHVIQVVGESRTAETVQFK